MTRYEQSQSQFESTTGRPVLEWRHALPELVGERVCVRNIEVDDAPALFAMLNATEVRRFISPPPPSLEAFQRFIVKSRLAQRAGQLACFTIVLKGAETMPVGLIQIRETERAFVTAEWGFAIGAEYWGLGLFQDAAHLVLEFAFEQLRAHRIEARAAINNGRGNRALQKLGAVREGVLRKAFLRDGEYVDQALYAIVEDDWRVARLASDTSGLVH